MKYSEFVKVAKPGDIIACSHQTWKTIPDIESQIVRMVTESEYSHVCVVISNDDNKPQVLEAIVPVVSISPLTKYLDYGFFHIATPDKSMTEAEREYGMSKLGQEYSKLEAIEGYFDLLKIGADQCWECAELTKCMRKLSGLEFAGKATPADVVRSALQKGYTLQFISKD